MAAIAVIASSSTDVNGAQTTCGNWTLEYQQSSDGPDTDIIITKATGSGDLDLTMVKGFNIVGALSSAFAYNNGLTSITIPASLTTLSAALSDKQQITGSGTPYTSSSPTESDKGIGIINLG